MSFDIFQLSLGIKLKNKEVKLYIIKTKNESGRERNFFKYNDFLEEIARKQGFLNDSEIK